MREWLIKTVLVSLVIFLGLSISIVALAILLGSSFVAFYLQLPVYILIIVIVLLGIAQSKKWKHARSMNAALIAGIFVTVLTVLSAVSLGPIEKIVSSNYAETTKGILIILTSFLTVFATTCITRVSREKMLN